MGGPGANTLRGAAGNDRLMADAPYSVDALDAGEGNDRLFTADDAPDSGTGGAGVDSILRDPIDQVAGVESEVVQ